MKFLCDAMLAGLGRWLRAAGYDTKISESKAKDQEILACAIQEDRLLITRDRHFLEMKAATERVIFLSANSLEECIQTLSQKVPIDWLFCPFSRCLLCNTLLIEPPQQNVAEQVPSAVFQRSEQFWYCPQCQKIYWQGSHTQHMLGQLRRWRKYLVR